jgi:hypothetical protein
MDSLIGAKSFVDAQADREERVRPAGQVLVDGAYEGEQHRAHAVDHPALPVPIKEALRIGAGAGERADGRRGRRGRVRGRVRTESCCVEISVVLGNVRLLLLVLLLRLRLRLRHSGDRHAGRDVLGHSLDDGGGGGGGEGIETSPALPAPVCVGVAGWWAVRGERLDGDGSQARKWLASGWVLGFGLVPHQPHQTFLRRSAHRLPRVSPSVSFPQPARGRHSAELDVRQPTADIRHPTSDIRHPTSDPAVHQYHVLIPIHKLVNKARL